MIDLPTALYVISSVSLCSYQDVPAKAFFGQAGHADPLDGWRCSSQNRVMSGLIQVRQLQTNESGFVISAINKYM